MINPANHSAELEDGTEMTMKSIQEAHPFVHVEQPVAAAGEYAVAEQPLTLEQVRTKLKSSSGRRFWRSAEELADSPAFGELLEREFPQQASEWIDPVTRRSFLKLAGASIALAGLAGCTKQPDEAIYPYIKAPEDLVGLKMYFRLAPKQRAELLGYVELLLFKGGYAGLQLIEGGVANLCLLIGRTQFQEAGGDWPGLRHFMERTCPHLGRRLVGATEALDRPLSIFRVPYGYVHAPGIADFPGLFRLGDQMGVIPSFCGDGVSIALHSAFAAVSAHRGDGAAAYHQRMRRDLERQIGRAEWLYRAGRARPELAVAAARAWPGALRWIARLTRVPPWALAEV